MLLRIVFLAVAFCQLIGAPATSALADHDARRHALICQTGATPESPRPPAEPLGSCDCCFFCGASADHHPFLPAHDRVTDVFRPSQEASAPPSVDHQLLSESLHRPRARAPPV